MLKKIKAALAWRVLFAAILCSAIAIWVFHAEGYSLLNQVERLFAIYQEWKNSWDWLSDNEGASVLIRNFGLLGAAFVGMYFAQRRIKIADKQTQIANDQARTANEQHKLSEQGQITDRYTKAVELFGDRENVSVRIGGLYALQRIALDSKKDLPTIQKVIANFIRHPPYYDPQKTKKNNEAIYGEDNETPDVENTNIELRDCPDIHVAIEVHQELNKHNPAPSLRRAKLPYVDLEEIDLKGVDLHEANLKEIALYKGILEKVNLYGANLQGANITMAKLAGANLYWANLAMANLAMADLTGAELIMANLARANLTGATFTGANLTWAELKEANLTGTHLKKVINLTQEQLDQAWAWEDHPPDLPEGLTVPLCPITYRKNGKNDFGPPEQWLKDLKDGKI